MERHADAELLSNWTRASELPEGAPDAAARVQALLTDIWYAIGPGDNPRIRKALFRHLVRCARFHGSTVRNHILDRWRWARTAREPGRAFCTAIVWRLRESQLYEVPPDA